MLVWFLWASINIHFYQEKWLHLLFIHVYYLCAIVELIARGCWAWREQNWKIDKMKMAVEWNTKRSKSKKNKERENETTIWKSMLKFTRKATAGCYIYKRQFIHLRALSCALNVADVFTFWTEKLWLLPFFHVNWSCASKLNFGHFCLISSFPKQTNNFLWHICSFILALYNTIHFELREWTNEQKSKNSEEHKSIQLTLNSSWCNFNIDKNKFSS